jgi:hypothetical protein
LLAVGFLCNLLVKPVADRHFMSDEDLERARKAAHDASPRASGTGQPRDDERTRPAIVAIAWLLVGVPIAWGVWTTLGKAWVLFR